MFLNVNLPTFPFLNMILPPFPFQNGNLPPFPFPPGGRYWDGGRSKWKWVKGPVFYRVPNEDLIDSCQGDPETALIYNLFLYFTTENTEEHGVSEGFSSESLREICGQKNMLHHGEQTCPTDNIGRLTLRKCLIYCSFPPGGRPG